MSEPKTPKQIRAELSELIHEAVPEPDAERRQALLVMADHWSAILRRRVEQSSRRR
jgi:hypothetical protein